MASRRDIAALAAAIYGEARGESRRGKEAVAHVAINRAEIGGVSLGDVVYGSVSPKWGQFSFANPQDNNAKTVRDAPRKDPRAWAEAVEIAVDVVEGRANGTKADPTKGATHYHADYASPKWSQGKTPTATIGRHEFYSLPKDETRSVVQRAARSQHRRQDLVDVAAVPADMVPSANRAAPETVAASSPEAGLLMALSGQAAPPSPEAGLLMDMPSQRAISDMVTPGRGLANLAPDGLRAPPSAHVETLDLTRPIAYSNTANRNREPYAGLVTHHDRVRDLQQIADITNYPREDGHMKGYHFAIDREGRIAQLAPLDQRVNHVGQVAGRGSAQTLTNRNSVAVVMLGADDKHTPAQEEALRSLAGNLREQGIELEVRMARGKRAEAFRRTGSAARGHDGHRAPCWRRES